MKRVATMADGWNPAGVPIEGMAQMFGAMQQMAKEAGRDPAELRMIVRANLYITEKPVEKDRHIFVGSLQQIHEDLAACEKIGAEEVFLEVGFTPGGQSLNNWLGLLEEFRPATAPAASRTSGRSSTEPVPDLMYPVERALGPASVATFFENPRDAARGATGCILGSFG